MAATNFFGVNVTDKNNVSEMDGRIFETKTLSEAQSNELDRQVEEADKISKKLSLPLPLKVLYYICIYGAVIILIGLLKAVVNSEISLAQSYKNAPEIYWILAICLFVWLALYLLMKKRAERTENSEEYKKFVESENELVQKFKQELDIPEDAQRIDVLCERYVMKNGNPKHKDFPQSGYINFDLFAFERKGNLCLSDMEHVWEIPMIYLRSITFDKKRRSFPSWNKDEAYNSAKYKPYKLTVNNVGMYFARCYRIEISSADGDFYLLIPNYDGETFMNITHLHPRTEI